MARIRGGADLDAVLGGVRRICEWKRRLASELPRVNAFFVIMRSNFREIPAFLKLMREHEIFEVALQTLEINRENSRRSPALERDEAIRTPGEVGELHAIMREALARERPHFRMIRVSGLQSLFAAHDLETEFLCEQDQGLYPDSDDLAGENGLECCPNPWTTLFIGESGSAHLCFLSSPIGNIYEAPLAAIWNSPRAMAKRSHVIAGRYLASGCSRQWCSWREGLAASARERFTKSLAAFAELSLRARSGPALPEPDQPVAAVRRALVSKNRLVAELEGMFEELCRINRDVHAEGQRYIDELEARLRSPLVRAAEKLTRAARRLRRSKG